MTCNLCSSEIGGLGLCQSCTNKVSNHLTHLPTLWKLAHLQLQPGKGSAGISAEMPIGVNVSALSFINGADILGILHGWEIITRGALRLTPPALIKKPLHLEDEIADAITFAVTHLSWMGTQGWISDFAREIEEVHNLGKTAAMEFSEKARMLGIRCPGTTTDGRPCHRHLDLPSDPTAYFTCAKCDNSWTLLALIFSSRKMRDSERTIWLDPEAIGLALGMSANAVTLFQRRHSREIAKSGILIDFKGFIATRQRASYKNLG